MPNILLSDNIGFRASVNGPLSPSDIFFTWLCSLSSIGSGLGVKGLPSSSIPKRYLSHPAKNNGMYLRVERSLLPEAMYALGFLQSAPVFLRCVTGNSLWCIWHKGVGKRWSITSVMKSSGFIMTGSTTTGRPSS